MTAKYSSTFTLNKELYYDFCSVSYNKTKNTSIVFFIMLTYLVVVNILVGNHNIVIGTGPIISFCLLLIYLRTSISISKSYERNLIFDGQDNTLTYELYEDKIISDVDGKKREYSYQQITKFYESNHFILLHLTYNIYVTLDKNTINATTDELKEFLLAKCTAVKKKKFINCTKDKTISLLLLIAAFIVTVVGVIVVFASKQNMQFN